MNDKIAMRAVDTHKALNQHFAEIARTHAHLSADSQTWTTTQATGSAAYVFFYLRVDCSLTFADGLHLQFSGNGGVLGLGATGSLGGQASFNVDPHTLKGASGISFEAFGLSVGAGGFQVTFFQNNVYIGHAEFYGAGVSLGTPGGGSGSFS